MKKTATKDQYEAAFMLENRQHYPLVDQMESDSGYAIDRDWLMRAARVLACPVKVNPPCWQHGRLLYSALCSYIEGSKTGTSSAAPLRIVDIGTAKGFSALCMAKACMDMMTPFRITSIDVIDPDSRVPRNTIAEVDAHRTLHEILEPFPESLTIDFVWAKAENWLMMNRERFHFAFVDGKHTYDAVKREVSLLSTCQEIGDVVMLDDLQFPGVRKAVGEMRGYLVRETSSVSDRIYALAEKQ